VRKGSNLDKLIDIAEEVGLKFHGGVGEDLAKLLAMEDWDCEEKERLGDEKGKI
jgi:hypothetical protein